MAVGADEYEAKLRRSSRQRRVAQGIAAAIVLGGLVWFIASGARGRDGAPAQAAEVVLTPAEQQELAAAIAQSRHRIAELDAPWRAAVMAVDPGAVSEGPPCTVFDWAKAGLAGNPQSSEWGSWPVKLPLRFNASSMASFGHAPFALTFIAADEDIPTLSPAAAGTNARLDELEQGGWSASTLEYRKGIATVDTLPKHDVLVRIDRVVEPKLQPGDLFTPGTIEVSAWAFDHETNSIVCAGRVTAASSPTVDPGSSNLNDDLLINLVRALPSGMRSL